jgi:hypothetical protein
LRAVGGFDERRLAADDFELYLKIARGAAVVCHGEVVTEYRRHGSNQTRGARLTLESELTVLRAQRRALRDGSERAAYRAGIDRARSEHGEALASEIRECIRRREWSDAFNRVVLLARWHPRGIFSLIRRS